MRDTKGTFLFFSKGTFHAKMGTIKDRNGMDLNRSRIYQGVALIHRRAIQKKILMIQITMRV